MIGIAEQWMKDWQANFARNISKAGASDGSVKLDRDALYGSSQRRSATVVPFSRSMPERIASTTNNWTDE